MDTNQTEEQTPLLTESPKTYSSIPSTHGLPFSPGIDRIEDNRTLQGNVEEEGRHSVPSETTHAYTGVNECNNNQPYGEIQKELDKLQGRDSQQFQGFERPHKNVRH